MEKLGVGAACSFRKGKRRRRERVGVGLLSKHMQPRVYHGIFQAPPDESEGRNGVGLVVIYLLPHFTSLPTTVVCMSYLQGVGLVVTFIYNHTSQDVSYLKDGIYMLIWSSIHWDYHLE